MSSELDDVFSSLLDGAKSKFGEAIYEAGDHKKHMSVINCPTAFGWFVGGTSGVPIGRVFGTDGFSGNYKSALMLEILRWWLLNGGFGIYVDAEEKTSDSMLRALLFNVPLAQRRRLLYAEAHSVEQWQAHALYWRGKAIELKKKELEGKISKGARVPICTIVDSLTGQDTNDSKKKISDEGSAQARNFSEQAMSISRFYKAWTTDGSLLNLGHVQHSKKSQDSNAKGDNEIVANGGEEPRFNASFHVRPTSSSTPKEMADGTHVEVYAKCIKSGLGDSKRKLTFKVRWKYVWRDMPVIEVIDHEASIHCQREVTLEEGVAYFEEVEKHMSYKDAVLLQDSMGLTPWFAVQEELEKVEARLLEITEILNGDVGARELKKLEKEIGTLSSRKDELTNQLPTVCLMPETEHRREQIMWFDWDWSLGWLLHEMKYGDLAKKDLKDKLAEIMEFTEGNKGYVKSKSLFEDDKQHSFTDFGALVRTNPELHKRVQAFLGIDHYQSYRDIAFYDVEPKKKKKTRNGF